jgi:hypothetical protein
LRNVLLWITAVFSVLTLLSRLADHQWPGSTTANALFFFDATEEATVANVFSALLLLGSAGLAVGIARVVRRPRWLVLAAALALLSLDEAVAVHESTIKPLRRTLDAGGFLYFTWVVPGAVLVVVGIVAFRSLLDDLDTRGRRLAVLAVVMFFGAALGFELIEGWVVDRSGHRALGLIPLVTVEEALEMVGATLFLYVLAERLAPWVGTLRLREAEDP